MSHLKKPVLLIGGPTACGKSRLALDLARSYKGTIINGDSIQLYQELKILSARPSEEDLHQAPHHLYGIITGKDPSSVERWREMALQEIAQSHQSNRLPLVVGGTGLYLKALCEGLSNIPKIPEEIRHNLKKRLEKEGLAVLYKELQLKDPRMADRLKPQDQQRILRALEVLEGTGASLQKWQKNQDPPPEDLEFIEIICLPNREELYKIAEARFERMLQEGALEETQALLTLSYDPSCSLMKALGVREIQGYLEGRLSWEELLEKGKTATRHYIKRQYTWFRQRLASSKNSHKIVLNNFYDERTFHELKNSLESTSAYKESLLRSSR